MPTFLPRHTDYTDAGATEIEHGPHWSQVPRIAPRPSLAALPKPPPLPRAHQVNAADRIVAPTPLAAPSPRPLAVPPPPLPAAAAPVAFYSFAEEQAALASPQNAWNVDTARVDPLPFGSIRPSWIDALDRMWSRFAAPALGLIAGLILVVGYLAYSSQAAPIASAASAPRPVAPAVVMTAQIDEPSAPEPPQVAAPIAPTVASPTVTEINVAESNVAPRVAKPARAKKAKRGPVRLNDSTPLGDLRPSR